MATITQYPQVAAATDDIIVIAKGSEEGLPTKTTTVQSILNLIDFIPIPGTGTVTDIGLIMPSAFNVAGTPIDTIGDFLVTGSGTTDQYINGLGELANVSSIPLTTPPLPLGSVYVGTGLSTPASTTSTVVNISDSLDSITIGENNVATGQWSMAQGFESYAAAPYSAALGYKAHALGDDSFASGHNSYAGGHGSAALGWGTSAGNEGAASFTASGATQTVMQLKDVAGVIANGMYMLTAFNDGSPATRYLVLNWAPIAGSRTGTVTLADPITHNIDQTCVFESAVPNRSDAAGSIAIGRSSFAFGENSIAIGKRAYTDQANQIAIGSDDLSVVFGDPQKKRTEWNNPGYFEMFAESYTQPGVYRETIDIDGDAFNEGGGYIGTYPSHTSGEPGWRVHTSPNPTNSSTGTIKTAPSTDMSFHNNNRGVQSSPTANMGWCDVGGNDQNLAFGGSYFQLSDGVNNLFRINATVADEPTVGAYINTGVKITGKTNLTVLQFADNAAAITGGLVIGDVYRTGDLLKIVH
jgi:hypothetical protein